jgi:sugar phosphate isomerase/epimerase
VTVPAFPGRLVVRSLTAPPGALGRALAAGAGRGCTHVEVVAAVDRPAEDLEALADSGVLVASALLGRHLPADCTLDAPDLPTRRRTLDLLERQVADAARLGATLACLPPCTGRDAVGPAAFADACALLAGYAAGRMVRLCVGHAPESLLPRATDALAWLAAAGHPDLGLALEPAPCLAAGEDPAAVARAAGDRLALVRLTSPAGCLNPGHMRDLAAALREVDAGGSVPLVIDAGASAEGVPS